MKLSNYLFACIFLTCLLGVAQEKTEETAPLSEEEQAAALAKATQNPLAAMYSLPFQNNTTFNGGINEDRTTNVLNIQPVIPISLSEKVNLINRIIIPVVTTPTGPDDSSTGFGDTSYSAWFSPAKAGKIIWGAGPVFQIPTASKSEFGSGEFGIGPSVVILKTIDKLVAGLVMNNTWTFGDAEENKFLFQYFVNYNLPKAWYLVTAPILTSNWNAPSDERWVVPFGGGAGKVFKIGKLPINFNAHVYYNTVRPTGYGDITTRFQLQFLFPKKK